MNWYRICDKLNSKTGRYEWGRWMKLTHDMDFSNCPYSVEFKK